MCRKLATSVRNLRKQKNTITKMNLKVRLALLNFLEFAVWGAYLTSMGTYLGKSEWLLR